MMNTQTPTLDQLNEALADARADVASIESTHAEVTRIAGVRADAHAKACATLDTAVAAQRAAERAYGDKPSDATAAALQEADRAVRVATFRRDDAAGDRERAEEHVGSAAQSLEKAKARVVDLEKRVSVEELRVAASPEVLHKRVDPLAHKALAIVEQLLEVHAAVGRELDASAQAAADYAKATGTTAAPVERQRAYLAIAEMLASRGFGFDSVRSAVGKIMGAAGHPNALPPGIAGPAMLVNGVVEALANGPHRTDQLDTHRRWLALCRSMPSLAGAHYELLRQERERQDGGPLPAQSSDPRRAPEGTRYADLSGTELAPGRARPSSEARRAW